jgi:O-antigen/teichoic acid export membrane protein
LQRMQVTNVLSFGGSLVAVVATLVAALVAPTVGAMVLATLAPVAVGRAISAYMLHRAEPDLFGRVSDIDWRAAPRIAGRGLVFAGISFASFLSLNAGLIVVAARLGSTQVAEVAVMVQLLPLALSIVGMIIVPLWPAIAEAAAEGDINWIARAGGRAAALVMAYAIAAGLVVVLGGEKLVGIWTGGRITIPLDILVAAAGLIIVASAESVTQTMLFGLGRAGTVAAILLFQGFLSLTFVYFFTDALGQAAVLAGPIAAQLVTGSWLLPLLVVRGFLAHERLRPLSELGGTQAADPGGWPPGGGGA